MLKELFSNRLFIGALVFFVLCVGSSLLYMWHVEREGAEYDAETQDRVAQWNEKQQPQPSAEVLVGDISQGGHFHEDGTWHGEPHETPVEVSKNELPVEDTAQGGHRHADGTWHEAPQLQEYAEYIPVHLLEAQSLVSVDMERARAAFRAALPEDPFSPDFEKAVKDAVQTLLDLNPGLYDLPSGHPRRVQSAIANNLLVAVSGVATELFGRYEESSSARAREILSWKEPYYALFTNTTQLEEEDNR